MATQYFKVTGSLQAGITKWQRIAGSGLEKAVLDAGATVAQHFLRDVRKAANVNADWAAAAKQAAVVRTGGSIHLKLPREAWDYEHGNPEKGIVARPVIQNTINRHRQEYSKLFSQALGSRLWGSK